MKNPIHFSNLLCALCALCGFPLTAQTPLKQSTAATVQIGPAVDASDGNTEVSDLTTTELEVSKAGGIFAALNGSATLTHDDDGFYRLALTTSDTDTLGLLRVKVIDATAMSFAEDFLILPANTYDSLYAGTDYLQTDVTQVSGSAAASDTTLETKIDTIDTVVDAILVDTGTTLPATLATIDTVVDAILIDTGTTIPATLGTPTDTDLATDIANVAAASVSLDAAEVRAAVGLAAANLDTQLSSLGAATDTLYTYTWTDLQQGTRIYIYSDANRTTLVRSDTADATGIVAFDLPAATYYYLAVRSGGGQATGSFTVTAE